MDYLFEIFPTNVTWLTVRYRAYSLPAGTELNPKNIVDPKQFELRTPDVVIKVAPGRSDLVETRVIDGNQYILIRANEGVELNGLNVRFDELPQQ